MARHVGSRRRLALGWASRYPMPNIRILPGRRPSGGGGWGRRTGAGEHDDLVIATALATSWGCRSEFFRRKESTVD